MIQKLHFNSYKKLKDIEIELKDGINIIAGTNGTCKSSILHVISNSFKQVPANSRVLSDNSCLATIKKLNKHVTPKVETLNKKPLKTVTDGKSGVIYKAFFKSGSVQSFRKHEVSSKPRYSLKPYYSSKNKETLTEAITIYLSLDRLYPFQEYPLEDSIKTFSKNLPNEYLEEITKQFKNFTTYDIDIHTPLEMGDIKKRYQFASDNLHIDSNTISSGEDNLLLLLISLYSLVYFTDCLDEQHRDVPAYLLIDEYDASLHPEFQIKFLGLFYSLQIKYPNISLVLTTHSLTTIEEGFNLKSNIIYLESFGDTVRTLEQPNIEKIKARLYVSLSKDIYRNIEIPIISEDDQARLFINKLFEYQRGIDKHFSDLSYRFKIVEASYSSEIIKSLFSHRNIPKRLFPVIGIYDGDVTNNHLDNCTVVLPGKDSPEKVVYATAKKLLNVQDPYVLNFWKTVSYDTDFTNEYMRKNIIPRFEELDKLIEYNRQNNISNSGVYRTESKKIFNDYKDQCASILGFYVSHPDNKTEIEKFFNDLRCVFHKICAYHGLSKDNWPFDKVKKE